MLYRLNIEQMEDQRIAHAAMLLGCYATAETAALAVSAAPGAIVDYPAWRGRPASAQTPQVEVNEVDRLGW